MSEVVGIGAPAKSSQFAEAATETAGEHRVRDGAIAVVIAVLALWLYRPFGANTLNVVDGGEAAYNAARLLDGHPLAGDLGMRYGPVQYYVRALLFGLFGRNLGVMSKEFVVMSALFVAASYWLLRGSSARAPALLLTALVGTLAVYPLYTQGVMYLALLAAVGCVVRYAYHEGRGWLIAAGVATGIVIGAQWDVGLFTLLLCCLAVIGVPYLRRMHGAAPSVAGWRAAAIRLGTLFGSAVLVALALYAPALFSDPGSLFRGMVLHRLNGPYLALPRPPLPSIRAVLSGSSTFPQFLAGAMDACPSYALYALAPVNALAVFLALRADLRERPSVPLVIHTVLTTLLAACLLVTNMGRFDAAHTLPVALFMLLSLALPLQVLAQLRLTAPVGSTLLRWVMAAAILAIVVPTALAGIQGMASRWHQPPPAGALSSASVSGALTDPATATNYDALVAYIKGHTAPGDRIFSGNTRHDLLSGNDVLLYFATDRQPGVRDYTMLPGITTRGDVQQRIVDDLRRTSVPLVVLFDGGIPQEPNRSRESSGATVLDDYLAGTYRVVERFGSYFVLAPRASVAAPCGATDVPGTSGYVDAASDPVTGSNTTPHTGQFRVGGWAVTASGGAPLARVEVRINDQLVFPVLQCIPRADVATLYGESARYSGWQVTVDARGITKTGPIDVRAEVVDEAGDRHPIPAVAGFRFDIAP